MNNHLENLKWFDMYARIPNIFNSFNIRKLIFKIGIGRIPFGRENSGKLEIKIPSDYIDQLARNNIIKKDINHLNELKIHILNMMTPAYIEKINLEDQRQWFLNP